MTTLSDLIAAYANAVNDHKQGTANDPYGKKDEALLQTKRALLDFVLSHAAEFAERERLERAVVEAWRASEDKRNAMLADDQDRRKLNAWAEAGREWQRQEEKLTAWLVAHTE